MTMTRFTAGGTDSAGVFFCRKVVNPRILYYYYHINANSC